ncbi:MAG: DUF294 nucleotidyltransferase-like domain-containing protein [Desulfotomaculales bacterium]
MPDTEDVREVLRNMEPFRALDDEVIGELAPQLHLAHFTKGSYVFKQGTPSLHKLFLVVKGLAEVTVAGEQGVATVVGYRRPGEFFGETVVLTDESYPGSVMAKEDLTCLVIPREIFENLMYHNPDVAAFFSRTLLERMRGLYREIVAEQSYEAYSPTESPLFRRRVKELMSRPVVTCRLADPVTVVASLMQEHNISAVVVIDDEGQPVGLITERVLVNKLLVEPRCRPEECTAQDVMSTRLITVEQEAFLNQALLEVIKHGVKHIVVMDRGMLAGIVSLVDLVRARSTGTFWIAHRIETQTSLEGLAEIGKEVDAFLNALVAEKASVRDIFALVSELYDALTRRIIKLCEEELAAEGWGTPPVPYCWINMGSGGRREQIMRTDQDNGIIYASPDPETAETVSAYFELLGTRIVDGLVRCGFAPCKGGVMASNPAWCRSLDAWEARARRWIYRADPNDVRMLTIFLDFRPVWGETGLADSLWDSVFRAFKSSSAASALLARDELQYRVPLSFLGGFITEKSGPHKNEIDLKAAACVHIVNCVRIFAVTHGIRDTSTFGRLDDLVAAEVISRDDAEFISAAYETLMMFRIRENIKKMAQGKRPDNYVNPHLLSKREQALLKDAFSVITRLQKITAGQFSDFGQHYLTS